MRGRQSNADMRSQKQFVTLRILNKAFAVRETIAMHQRDDIHVKADALDPDEYLAKNIESWYRRPASVVLKKTRRDECLIVADVGRINLLLDAYCLGNL